MKKVTKYGSIWEEIELKDALKVIPKVGSHAYYLEEIDGRVGICGDTVTSVRLCERTADKMFVIEVHFKHKKEPIQIYFCQLNDPSDLDVRASAGSFTKEFILNGIDTSGMFLKEYDTETPKVKETAPIDEPVATSNKYFY